VLHVQMMRCLCFVTSPWVMQMQGAPTVVRASMSTQTGAQRRVAYGLDCVSIARGGVHARVTID
jgi:hypothetical protein